MERLPQVETLMDSAFDALVVGKHTCEVHYSVMLELGTLAISLTCFYFALVLWAARGPVESSFAMRKIILPFADIKIVSTVASLIIKLFIYLPLHDS